MSHSTKRTILYFVMIVLVVTAIRGPLLNIPFERDEGEYAYIAWRLGHHELPYRDWIDQKPPAIFWAYQLALSLPFDSVCAVHLMGLLWAAAAACALFILASRFMKPFWALVAALLFAILLAEPAIEGTAANTELFMLLPLILSQIAFFQANTVNRRGILFMIMAGALTGIAAAFKQVAAVNWFFLVAIYPLFATGEKRMRQTLFFGVFSAVGAALVWGIICAYFFIRHGFADFIYNVFTHNLEYIQSVSWSLRPALCRATLATLCSTQALVWIFSTACLVTLLATKRIKLFLFLAGWLVASMIGVSASGYFFRHYFQQLLPVLCLTAALGAEALDDARFWIKIPAWSRRTILGSLFAIPPIIMLWPFLISYSPEEAVQKIFPGNEFAKMRVLGKRIAQITHPDDRLFIFGAEPEVFFYAQRVSATRYIFLFPLYGHYTDALEKQQATAQEVFTNRPAAALFIPNKEFSVPGSEQFFTKWSKSYLHAKFRVDTYLTKDDAGESHLVSGTDDQGPSVPPDQHVFGMVLVKKTDDP